MPAERMYVMKILREVNFIPSTTRVRFTTETIWKAWKQAIQAMKRNPHVTMKLEAKHPGLA
jgi:hypothetical protein